ncbi:hypothetical protein E5E27_00545 [Helicobacter pylori]|nr:hypothetical protein E5E27_00545 [Helicobacter pylori]
MLTRKALFFKVCMDISYPKKTILTYFSLTAMRLYLATLKDRVFRASGINGKF